MDDTGRLFDLGGPPAANQPNLDPAGSRSTGGGRFVETSRFRGSVSAGQASFSEILDSQESEAKFSAFRVDVRLSRVSFFRLVFREGRLGIGIL
jgi:hypothetical protein